MTDLAEHIADLRHQRHRMWVRAGLTHDLYERAVLQASARSISDEITQARSGHVALRASGGFEGAALVLIADEGDVTYADGSTSPQHCTLCYLGDAADLSGPQRSAARAATRKVASHLAPFTPKVLSPARFGNDDVLLVEHAAIQKARDIAMSDRRVRQMVLDNPDAHPHFIPHVAGATDAPKFSRAGLWLGDEERVDYPLTGKSLTAAFWNATLHPRGRDGRFIEVGGLLRLFGFGEDEEGDRVDLSGKRGQVERIDGPDEIYVRDPNSGERYKVKSSQVEEAPEAKAFVQRNVVPTGEEVAPTRATLAGRDGTAIEPGQKVDLVDMAGFRHGQRGKYEVEGEVTEITTGPGGNTVVRVKMTDPRWDPEQFGAVYDARPDQVAQHGWQPEKKPKAKTPTISKQYKAKPVYNDTGTPPPVTPRPGMTDATNSPHLPPLEPPDGWAEMTPDDRVQWVEDRMEADYTKWRGKETRFSFMGFDSGVTLNLANTYRDLTNSDPDTAMRIDYLVPDHENPEGLMGANAIAVANPGTAHPGGIGPKIKDAGIVLGITYFGSSGANFWAKQQAMSASKGGVHHSISSKYGDGNLTLVHEYAHQRQFRFLDVAMRDVGKAWSPVVTEDGFGMIPDSSNWQETQALRYQIQELAPTNYGKSKSSEAFAEAWAARATGDASPELVAALDQWDAYMAVSLGLPEERYTSTKKFEDLTPAEKDQFWATHGPLLDLPGMRTHHPESAKAYDDWTAGKQTSPAPDSAPAQLALDLGDSLAVDWNEGEAALTFGPAPGVDVDDTRTVDEIEDEMRRLDTEHAQVVAEKRPGWRRRARNLTFERHYLFKLREQRRREQTLATWNEGEAAMEAVPGSNAKVFAEADDIDILGSYPPVSVRGDSLQPGMVLLDPELGTPAAMVDHKVGRAKQGSTTYLLHDLEKGGWFQSPFTSNKTFIVAGEPL